MRVLCKGAEMDFQHELQGLPDQVASHGGKGSSAPVVERLPSRAWGGSDVGIDCGSEI